jgi:hypothetical protein
MSIFGGEAIKTVRGPYGRGTWVRVDAGFYSLPVEALVGDIADARGVDLAKLGFGRMATTPGPQPIPRLEKVVLDLASRVDADFYLCDDSGQPIGMLFGAKFQDPHPDRWWNSMHSRGSAIVVLGPTQDILQDTPGTLEEFVELLKTMWVAEVPLLVRGWETGVGSHNEASTS